MGVSILDRALADLLIQADSQRLYYSTRQEKSTIEAVSQLCVTHILSKFAENI